MARRRPSASRCLAVTCDNTGGWKAGAEMAGLKVRLDDGSEVGPLDLRMVQTWYQQGLIGPEAMVQKPGSPRWIRLSEAADLERMGSGPIKRRARRRAARGARIPSGKGGGPLEALCRRGALLRSGRRRRALRVLPRSRAARAGRRALAADRAGPGRSRSWPRARLGWGRRVVRVVALLDRRSGVPTGGRVRREGHARRGALGPGLRVCCSPRGSRRSSPRASRVSCPRPACC